MNIVKVKYQNAQTIDISFVPEDRLLNTGDLVITETNHGKELATCLCDNIKINIADKDESKNIFSIFGASYPTTHVIGKFTYDEWERTQ